MTESIFQYLCPTCGGERPFERPHEVDGCPDGFGDDCPEVACVECGTALVIGPGRVEPGGIAGAETARVA